MALMDQYKLGQFKRARTEAGANSEINFHRELHGTLVHVLDF